MGNFDTDRLGKRILERLRVLNMTQAEVARRADVAPSWVTDLLKGRKRSVRADNLSAIARALLTTPAYLLGETGDPNPSNVSDPEQLAKLMPRLAISPAIARHTAPAADFVEPARANKGFLFRPHAPQYSRPFFTDAMQKTFEKHWDEVLGKDDPWPRIPLLADLVPGVAGAVHLPEDLPNATPSLPVLGRGGGAYALAMPDDSMAPVEMGWLVYVKPGPTFFGGLVALRLEHAVHGGILLVRRLLEIKEATVIAGTLSPAAEETFEMSCIRSIHPVFAAGRDPALYGPDDERTLRAQEEDRLARIEAESGSDEQD